MKRIAVLVVLAASAMARNASGMTLGEYELGWARYYAQQDGVPVELVEAIIVVESGGDPYAVSSKGAAGVMQLMPATAYDFRVRNRFLVQENILGGVGYLASLLREFHGDLRLAVAGYYAGEGLVRKKGLECSSPQVVEYVRRVAAVYRVLRARGR